MADLSRIMLRSGNTNLNAIAIHPVHANNNKHAGILILMLRGADHKTGSTATASSYRCPKEST